LLHTQITAARLGPLVAEAGGVAFCGLGVLAADLISDRYKACLLKIPIAGEGLAEAFFFHHDKRNAISERPGFVGAFFKEIDPTPEQLGIGGDDLDPGMLEQRAANSNEVRPILRITVGITEFDEYPLGGEDPEAGIA
jgi:hypothetical protein